MSEPFTGRRYGGPKNRAENHLSGDQKQQQDEEQTLDVSAALLTYTHHFHQQQQKLPANQNNEINQEQDRRTICTQILLDQLHPINLQQQHLEQAQTNPGFQVIQQPGGDGRNIMSSLLFGNNNAHGEQSLSNSDADADTTDQPGSHDVLLGRGGETNNHSGNIKFRRLVNEYKESYREASKIEKPAVARRLVAHWRGLHPRGRFLAKTRRPNTKTMVWKDVGDGQAQKRASKSLGEREKPPKRHIAPAPVATLEATLIGWGDLNDVTADSQVDRKMPPASSAVAGTTTANSQSTSFQAATAPRLPVVEVPATSFASAHSNATASSTYSAQSTRAGGDGSGGGYQNNLSLNDAFQEENLDNSFNFETQQSLIIKQMTPTAADLVSSVFNSSCSSSSSGSSSSKSESGRGSTNTGGGVPV